MDKKKLNNIVFETLFRQALIDEFEKELDYIQLGKSDKIYTPSPKFQIKMRKLLKKNNEKLVIMNLIIYFKKVSITLFFILGCIFTILFLDEEVQSTVNKIIIEIYKKFNSIIFKG